MTDKRVGVISGMGPAAGIDFMARVMALTPAHSDQDHVRLLVDHDPTMPSRQAAMAGNGADPGDHIAAMALRLQTAGADALVMPCNLAHAWQQHIEAAVDIPFISIVDVTVAAACNRSAGEGAVGLLTTPGCFRARLYQQALAIRQLPVIEQTDEELDETMRWVERIKSGDLSAAVVSGLVALAERLIERGATVIIAACTELPLVLSEEMLDVALVSSTDELARATVAFARQTQTRSMSR